MGIKVRDISHIVIHCSATPDGHDTTLEDIDRMHRERGFARVGYHYVIELDGAVMPGRPLEAVGAHVQGSNLKSIGICMIGTARFADLQWDSLRALLLDLVAQFPEAEVCGHRDFSPDLDGDGVVEEHEWFKLCPGFDVAAWRLAGMVTAWNPAHLWA
jgi:N-acetyl-anhydromuramyl-L-alanine amidase AmpD